jgi:nicotinamide-nucleotide amidase
MHNNFFVLAKRLGQLCVANDVHIALAESCTGGWVSAKITDVAGSAGWFNGSAVVYSNESKSNLLGIDQTLIQEFGAVSEPVAKAMAQSALHRFHSDLALSITGIAGPGGGTLQKPVGMVCFALADKKGVDAKTLHFSSGRDYIRESAAFFALEWMIKHLSIII